MHLPFSWIANLLRFAGPSDAGHCRPLSLGTRDRLSRSVSAEICC
jgi:hypothetical protein